jgi:hypothetical protein
MCLGSTGIAVLSACCYENEVVARKRFRAVSGWIYRVRAKFEEEQKRLGH